MTLAQQDASHQRRHSGERRPVVEVLHETFRPSAAACSVATVTVGLGYTAVELANGDLGLSYTMAGDTACCARLRDFDGAPALELLECMRGRDTLERSLGVALVNALNQRRALTMPEDAAPGGAFMTHMGIGVGTRVAMVGFFPPVVARLKTVGAVVDVLDRDLKMGDEARFLCDIAAGPDVLIVTATTILNASFELFMDHVGPEVRVIVLGPTTPMVPEAFGAFQVAMLGGMVPLNNERVVSAVRQAALTPALQRYCRKVYWTADEPATAIT
jgi:uncharacterized protein